jgi:hypothetical protein
MKPEEDVREFKETNWGRLVIMSLWRTGKEGTLPVLTCVWHQGTTRMFGQVEMDKPYILLESWETGRWVAEERIRAINFASLWLLVESGTIITSQIYHPFYTTRNNWLTRIANCNVKGS